MCDLSDSRIIEAYNAIVEEDTANWLLLGYHDTRDVISLYSSGSGGLNEFRNKLTDEVLYGLVKVEDRNILITWVSEHVSGVRRARALVHSRSVASLLKLHHAQITASNLNDLSDANIRTRLKLGEQQLSARKSSSSLSDPKQKRGSRQLSGIPLPQSPIQRKPSQEDDFVEASETLPNEEEPMADTTKVEIDDDVLIKNQERDRKLKEQEEAARKKEQEEKRAAAQRKQEEEEKAERQRLAQKEEERQKLAQKEAERKRLLAEKEEAKRKEEERLKKEAEEKRQTEEKKRLQQKLLEAEKNKDVLLSGFISVQPNGSPFWRRRYFTIKGKTMALYTDELSRTPIQVLDLTSVTRLNSVDVDVETFVPNAFVLETKLNGSYQLFADDKKGLEIILTALQTVI